MSTQATTSTLGNAQISRVFTNTNTDGVYGNTTDSVSAVSAGLSLPNVTITYVCSTIAAGCGTWRILNTTSNKVMRMGLCSLASYVDYQECSIVPYRMQSDDVFQIFTYAVDATANQTNCIAIVTSSRGREVFGATDVIDSTPTAMTSLVSGLGMGDLLFGATVTNVEVQVESTGHLLNIRMIRADGGNQWQAFGNYRLPTAGATSTLSNGDFPMSIPIEQGWALQCSTLTA